MKTIESIIGSKNLMMLIARYQEKRVHRGLGARRRKKDKLGRKQLMKEAN
tara:strand:+ start:836 stop:985 length:150 start_codon:yes stop_codon:yes gene_type:complete